MNQMMRLSARATPGIDRTRSTRVSVNVCEKSMFGVFRDVTQRSAFACSMVTEALSSRPRKSPTCTKTSVTANATPATVMKKRSRSCTRLLSARSTIENAVQHQVEHGLDSLFVGPPVHPRIATLGDLQRDESVHGRPDGLGRQLDVLVLGPYLARRDGLTDGPRQEGVRVLVRLAALLERRHVRRMRRHEHQPVMVRKLDRESRIRPTHAFHAIDRIRDCRDLLELDGERAIIHVAQLADQRVLVLEVVVDRRRRVLDPLGDLPHRHRLISLLGEQLARGVQDLSPDRELLAFAAVGGGGWHHNVVLNSNIVKIQTAVKGDNTVRGSGITAFVIYDAWFPPGRSRRARPYRLCANDLWLTMTAPMAHPLGTPPARSNHARASTRRSTCRARPRPTPGRPRRRAGSPQRHSARDRCRRAPGA